MTLLGLAAAITFGPVLAALVVALFTRFLVPGQFGNPSGTSPIRRWAMAGALLPVAIMLTVMALQLPGGPVTLFNRFVAYGAPLAAGLVALLVLIGPRAPRDRAGSADLTPRNFTSFASRGWALTFFAVLVLTVVTTLGAGSLSIRDEQGNFTMYRVDAGTLEIGTGIYGWHYSLPLLGLTTLLVITTVAGVVLIARSPLASEAAADSAIRRWRTRNILAVATGAVTIHLGKILNSLSGTAMATGGMSTSEGWVRASTTIAALETPLKVLAIVAAVAGWFIWFSMLLTAIKRSQARSRDRGTAP